VANALAKSSSHPLAFMHMPVPIAHMNDAFFAPLQNLELAAPTERYLGVVYAADGVEGTQKRIAVAAKYVKAFGIATQCGIARARTPDLVESLIEIHAAASGEQLTTRIHCNATRAQTRLRRRNSG
jgi:hypothetical protein